jgi:hypothetical protein
MLNPSIADALDDDHTVTKCVRFAQKNDFSGIEIVNIFPLVSTKPEALTAYDHSKDQERNIAHVFDTRTRMPLVLAFGNITNRGQRQALSGVLYALGNREVFSIGPPTKAGYPRHPAYASYDLPLVPYSFDALRT